jgi:predicted small integral membrane protein
MGIVPGVDLDEKGEHTDLPTGGSGVNIPLRPCLALMAVGVLSLAMAPELIDPARGRLVGVYSPRTITAAVIACLLAVAACTLPPRRWRLPAVTTRLVPAGAALFLAAHAGYRAIDPADETPDWAKAIVALTALVVAAWAAFVGRSRVSLPGVLVGSLALVLSGEAVFCTALNPVYNEALKQAVQVAAVAGFVLTASLLIHLSAPAIGLRRLLIAQVLLIFVAGAVLRFAAAVAAPDPGLDVYYAQRDGADHLLAGQNPYTAAYPDPNVSGGRFSGAPFYPPFPLLVSTAIWACGLDVRVGNAAGDLVAALALFTLAWTRGERLPAALLAACYLHFPRVPLIMELAWYEPMLAAALGLGLLLVARGWRLGYFLLGLGITGKQYAVVLFPPLLKALRGRRLALVGGTVLAGVVVVLPFFLWDEQPFLDRVVLHHLDQPVRLDGVTLQAAALNEFGVEVPKWLMYCLALLLIGLVTWRTPAHGQNAAPWMATSLLIFCLFFSQAFINYYYLCQYLMLVGLGDWFAGDAD